ncbi:MAG: leucine-rich repeat protein, partial [Alloprevotella sp.]|nr:leucine-rich repeat protein [Alloprevotella sp.]
MKKILLLLLLACLTSAVQAQSKYDLNTDNEVNVGDVTTLVNAILGKGGEGADLNGDNAVNVGDVTKLVNVILGKEPAEEEPAELQDAGYDRWTDGVLLYEVTDEEKAEVTVWNTAEENNLVSVNIPAEVKINAKVYTVTSIDEVAFDGEENLTSVILPATIVSIDANAFNSCTALKSIEIPNSVITIGDYAFAYCQSLTSLSLGSSVTSIGRQAFDCCVGLTSLTIPASVTTIELGAFDMCGGVESIVVEKENTAYDSRDNCHAIIETASNKLIAGCKTTVIPATVEAIGDYAFSGHKGLKSITIPASVMSIGNYVFADCTELENIVVEKENTTYDSRDNCHAIIETASNKLIAGCKTTVI